MTLRSSGSGSRPRVFDVTHLVSRLDRQALTGIDRVDLMYARHVAQADWGGLHYGLWRPHRWTGTRVRALVRRFEAKVRDTARTDGDAAWQRVRDFITGDAAAAPGAASQSHDRRNWGQLPRQTALRIFADSGPGAPQDALYLNVAQCGFEFHRFFRWMRDRPDVLPVFFVHDLLPLDVPEYFRDRYEARFQRRVETVVDHAKALIVSSTTVRDRLHRDYVRRGLRLPPTLVAHLPSALGGPRVTEDDDAGLAATPYFVMTGTLEPRKNHRLILDVWMALGASAPKLVLVGNDGWGCDHIKGLLSRSPTLRAKVMRTSALSRAALRCLVANARAVLVPSFAEGYGLPLAEARSLGTPAIASDIPVFREIGGAATRFLSPLDGLGWLGAITEAMRVPPTRGTPAAPTEAGYFAEVDRFLATL